MHKTILNEATSEVIINKSRFIAHIKPITTEEEAQRYIEVIKKKHNQAAHNVPVFLLGMPYHIERCSDDGEPSGTAGVPVLDMLKKMQITNVCLVITRYFGGVKLGTGGLVRAYTESVKSVLEAVGLVTVDQYIGFQIQLDYCHHGKVMNLIAIEGCYLVGTDFTDRVVMHLYAETGVYKSIQSDIIELTSDTAVWLCEDIVYGTSNNLVAQAYTPMRALVCPEIHEM